MRKRLFGSTEKPLSRCQRACSAKRQSTFRASAEHNRLDINVLRKNRKSRPQPDKKHFPAYRLVSDGAEPGLCVIIVENKQLYGSLHNMKEYYKACGMHNKWSFHGKRGTAYRKASYETPARRMRRGAGRQAGSDEGLCHETKQGTPRPDRLLPRTHLRNCRPYPKAEV